MKTLLPAICAVMAVLFLAQSMACLIEHETPVCCVDGDASADQNHTDARGHGCCQSHHVAVLVLAACFIHPDSIGTMRSIDLAGPEGPAREIDYPPQLS